MKLYNNHSLILESKKLYYKSIPQMFEYINGLPENMVFLDTETTGLGGSKFQQLTQISAVVVDKKFNEISFFDEKIELTNDIKSRMEKDIEFPNGIGNNKSKDFIKEPCSTNKILKFNHYHDGGYEYKNEKEVIIEFSKWLSDYKKCVLIAQNAPFDMDMLNGRYGNIIGKHPVLDTKMIIQLFYIPLLQKLSETDLKYKNIIDRIGTSSRDNGLISSSMSKIGPSLNIDMDNYHDALTDCRITIIMVKKIFNLLNKYQNIDIQEYQMDRIKNI